ncbi:hypothetical protein PV327_011413, partial [Microctonus hyperodae]
MRLFICNGNFVSVGHGISEMTMPLFDEKKMIELIPKIGDRMIFELKWKKRYGKNECPTSQDMDNKSNETSRELSNTIHEYSSSEDGDIKPYKLVRENAFMGKTSYSRSKELSTVRQILQNDYQGAIILKNYKSIKTYYIAPTSKALSHNKKSIPSRGKLVDKYRNKLRQRRILSAVVNIPETEIFQEESDDEGHNSFYLKLFNEDLKPKFHYLIHYPRIMPLLGPLKFYSSMPFEAKHKTLKETAKITTSRRNPCHTIATKHQYQLCHRLLSRHGFPSQYMAGTMIAQELDLLEGYGEFKNILPLDIDDR